MAQDKHLKETAVAWQQFIGTGHLHQPSVPQVVLASWQNCRERGVDPWENRKIQAGFVPGQEVAALRITRSRRRPAETLKAIGEFADENRVVLSVYDNQGNFIEPLNHQFPSSMADQLGVSSLFLGQLTEDMSGTNAVTLAMREAATVRLAGYEHYHSWFHAFSCSAAPLRDGRGHIAGAVGASSLDVHQPVMVLPFLRCVADLYQHWRWLEYDRNKTRYWQGVQLMTSSPDPPKMPNPLNQLVGYSHEMKVVKEKLAAVAQSELPVMLTGESGVGKEVAAQVIHQLSARRKGPLIAINCGALSETLAETTLFGYGRGAFTGARSVGKPGLIEASHGGTLFLDELESLSPTVQVMLLRCLAEKKILPVGGTEERPVDFRLVSASKITGEQALAEGVWRADFYYRIGGYDIAIPPLRHRREDIPLLMEVLLKQLAETMGRAIPRLTEEAISCLCHYPWPGNVRQLKNLMEQLLITCQNDEITISDLPEIIRYHSAWLNRGAEAGSVTTAGNQGAIQWTPAGDGKKLLNHLERQMARQVLKESDGNISEAARRLGISRPTLYRIIKDTREEV
ncbi:sigma-54 interaction domain-containing protein [Anoxynatronum buryatiense]|uniref:Regulatory protein, Fis family n=1 Tax=Anoxynatronum buryatiense TaxID=489973 RepID=A0AA46AK14_9CLOT|nr:sigma 54-interacting transcriptional regulator [Anoxynatronum buryatiense]SMP66663.1 regulatory protein, Fis family [Anoxynatronum buryatiense]